MALTKPTLYQQVAFDATNISTFTFDVQGGNQVTANQLIIKNNTTNAIIYSEVQQTFKFEHIVLANTLVNGTYYNATLITYDASNNASVSSNAIQFYCYTTPTITFTNIPNGNIITNSSYSFEFEYDQEEDELLNTYVVNLYNSSNAIISTSGEQYSLSSAPPNTFSYMFSGFEDNSSYSIQIVGKTINGTSVYSPFVAFNVNYILPNLFAVVELENNCKGGYVAIQSNIVLVEGESYPITPNYINLKEIDLTANGRYVKWASGFSISNNFTAKIWGRDFNENTDVFVLTSKDNENIYLRYMVDYEDSNKIYFDLRVDGGYYIHSQSITKPSSTDYLNIQIRRINNVYELFLENVGEVE